MALWFKIPEKLRFLIVGGWNTFFGLMVFSSLFLLIKNYKISLVFSHIVGVFQNLIVFRWLVFGSQNEKKGNFWQELWKINAVYFVYFCINFALLFVLVELLQIYPIASQILITCILVIFSYLANKHFTFKK